MSKINFNTVKRINVALIIIAVIVGVYTAINTIKTQYDIKIKNQTIVELNEEVAMQGQTNEQLLNILYEGATDEAIIEVAQNKLGLALPGERVMVDIGSK